MPTDARQVIGYSQISEKVLGQASVIRTVANTEVEGTVGFETVKVYVNDLATIANYVPGTGVSLTNDGSNYVDINTKQEKAINELLDGYTVETAPADLVASRLEAALVKMGEQMDTDAFVAMVADGTEAVADTGALPTAATIYEDILGLKLELDKAKAPRTGRFLIVSPEMENLLLDTDSKIILNTQRGDGIITEGFVGRLLGFDVFSTVLLPAGTNMIAGQQRGFAFKEGWKIPPRRQNLDGSGQFIGDSAVQGRIAYVYGAVRPTLIQVHNGVGAQA
jgi:hypothetical protein